MATIANLVVNLSADPTGLRAGINSAAASIKTFQALQNNLKTVNGTALFSGLSAAGLAEGEKLTRGLNAQFASASTDLRESLFQGLINKGQFDKAAKDAAQEYNSGLTAGLNDLGSRGLLSPVLQQSLVAQYKDLGLQAGGAFASNMAASAARTNAVADSFIGLGAKLTAGVTLPVIAIGAEMVHLAAQSETSATRLRLVFGPEGVGAMNRSLEELHKTIPATSTELRTMAARVGEIIIPLGVAPQKAAEMSLNLVKLSKDLSILNDVSPERAINALSGAMIGQTRTLKLLGIDVTQQSIKDEARRLGLVKQGGTLTDLGKAEAAYSLIQQRSGLITGAVAAAAGNAAVQFRFLTRDLKDTGAELGAVLLPFVIAAVSRLRDLIKSFQDGGQATAVNTIKILAMAAAVGPLITLIGGLTKVYALFQAALAAGAAGGASGLLGGLATLLTPGGVLLAGLVTAVVLIKEIHDALQDNVNTIGAFGEGVKNLGAKASAELTNKLTNQLKVTNDRILESKASLDKINAIKVNPDIGSASVNAARSKEKEHLAYLLDTQKELIKQRDYMIAQTTKTASGEAITNNEIAKRKAYLDSISHATSTDKVKTGKTDEDPFTTGIQERTTIIGKSLEFINEQQQKLTKGTAQQLVLETQRQLLLDQERKLQSQVTTEVEKRGGVLADNVGALLDESSGIQKTLDKFGAELKPIPLHFTPLPLFDFKGIDDAARALQVALDRERIAVRIGGDTSEAKSAVEQAQRNLGVSESAVLKIARDLHLTDQQTSDLIKEIDTRTQGVGRSLQGVVKDASAFSQFLSGISVAVKGVRDLSAAFGGVSDQMNKIVNGVTGMSDAIKQITDSSKLTDTFGKIAGIASGLTGVIGAGASLLSGLFGGNKEQDRLSKETGQITQHNTDALLQLKQSLDHSLSTGGGLQHVADVVKNLISTGGATTVNNIRDTGQNRALEQLNTLNTLLKGTGLTFDDLDTVAKNLGITLRDSRLNIIPGALDALANAIQLNEKKITQFGDSLDGARAKADLKNALFGAPGANSDQTKLDTELGFLTTLAPKIAANFKSLDSTTQTGRDAIKSALQNLFLSIEAGNLKGGDLGKLQNLDELISIITNTNDALTGLGTAANATTSALRNVPTGFKVALDRFNSIDPTTLTQTTSGLSNKSLPFPGRAPAAPPDPSGWGTTGAGTAGGGGDGVNVGVININGANKDGRQLADEMITGLRDRARARFGNPNRWSEVQN